MHNTLLQQQNNTEKNHFFFTCAVKIIVANARVGSIIAKPASITQVITALSVDWCCFAQCEQNNEKERRGSEGGLHVVCTVGYFLVWKNKMNAWEFVSPGKKRNDVCIGLEEGLKDDCCRRAWMGAVSLSLREEWMCRRKTFVVANAMPCFHVCRQQPQPHENWPITKSVFSYNMVLRLIFCSIVKPFLYYFTTQTSKRRIERATRCSTK